MIRSEIGRNKRLTSFIITHKSSQYRHIPLLKRGWAVAFINYFDLMLEICNDEVMF